MYNYFAVWYNQISLYWSNWLVNMNTYNTKSNMKVQNSNKFKKCRPRSLLQRNAHSPYTENETKAIRSINYIITDDKRKSRLGKLVSYPYSPGIKLVEDGHFCSFIREWFVVE